MPVEDVDHLDDEPNDGSDEELILDTGNAVSNVESFLRLPRELK